MAFGKSGSESSRMHNSKFDIGHSRLCRSNLVNEETNEFSCIREQDEVSFRKVRANDLLILQIVP